MAKFAVCVVDDSREDADECVKFLTNIHEISRVIAITEPFDLRRVIETEDIDVVFMDIEMPDANGFQIYESIPVAKRPVLVLVTNHENYGLQGFKLEAADYILKPVNFSSISNAFVRALKQMNIPVTPMHLPEREYFYCHLKDGGNRFLFFKDIIYVEGNGNYSNVYARGNVKHQIAVGIGGLAREIPTAYYVRIHNSYIVNVRFITSVINKRVYLVEGDANGLPISRRYHAELRKTAAGFQKK